VPALAVAESPCWSRGFAKYWQRPFRCVRGLAGFR
jgi:hypothetical protein